MSRYQSNIIKVRVGGMQVPITGASKAVSKYHGSILLAIRDRKAFKVCNTIQFNCSLLVSKPENEWLDKKTHRDCTTNGL